MLRRLLHCLTLGLCGGSGPTPPATPEPHSYRGLGMDEIAARMDDRYAAGRAYDYELPWDSLRGREIHASIWRLASQFGGNPRNPGLTLDIGCGNGGIAAHWTHRPIVGIDISSQAVIQYRRRFPENECTASPVESFQDPAGRRFETIVAVESIEHWVDVDQGLARVRQHLAPGGLFVLSTPNRDSLHVRIGTKLGRSVPYCSFDHTHEYGHDELLALLAGHGFERVASEGVFLMPWWALEQDFGRRIRELSDRDTEVLSWLLESGRAVPHLAFIQCHAFRQTG